MKTSTTILKGWEDTGESDLVWVVTIILNNLSLKCCVLNPKSSNTTITRWRVGSMGLSQQAKRNMPTYWHRFLSRSLASSSKNVKHTWKPSDSVFHISGNRCWKVYLLLLVRCCTANAISPLFSFGFIACLRSCAGFLKFWRYVTCTRLACTLSCRIF
jgi:hypothetical protein